MTVSASFLTGRKSGITTTAVQITNSTVKASKGVQVLANSANTVKVYVGPSGVTSDSSDSTDGYPLSAGESVLLPVRSPSEIFVKTASGSNQKIFCF